MVKNGGRVEGNGLYVEGGRQRRTRPKTEPWRARHKSGNLVSPFFIYLQSVIVLLVV